MSAPNRYYPWARYFKERSLPLAGHWSAAFPAHHQPNLTIAVDLVSHLNTCEISYPALVNTTSWIDSALLQDFAAEGTDAHRLCTYPDGWVERFGTDILVSYKNEAIKERLTTELALWALNCHFKFNRIFARYLPRRNTEREAPRLLLGDPRANLRTVATERLFRYGIDFAAGYSIGFFPDQRENRQFLRRIAPNKLLNCFAYTCSFSTVAASVGTITTNIDLSKKSLARGRENFALNSLTTNNHHFLVDDVFEVLPRLARRGDKFDCIILDPPTFSQSGRGREFRVERDFERLLLDTLEVTERDGHILISTNCTKLNEHSLEVMARFCLKTFRRAGTFHRVPPLPDFPSGTAAKTIWLRLR